MFSYLTEKFGIGPIIAETNDQVKNESRRYSAIRGCISFCRRRKQLSAPLDRLLGKVRRSFPDNLWGEVRVPRVAAALPKRVGSFPFKGFLGDFIIDFVR